MTSPGPQVEFSEQLHAEKYRGPGETFREYATRVASALSGNESEFFQFRETLLDQRFLPGGRIQRAVGATSARVTPYNCYVSAEIQDSFVDGHGSIMECAAEAAATLRMGGGIGYDFSTLRPRGDAIKKLGSRSSGPVSFMQIFDAVCRCVASSGHRRGAQMGVLRVDHPDIEEFVRCKQDQHSLTGFNISVAITDEFMECVRAGCLFALRFAGKVHKEVDARALWDVIMRATWDWAEPGVLFIDTIAKMNNLWYCEKIAATNPCGEQPLPPYGACLLGSFNLVRYVRTIDGKDAQAYRNTPGAFYLFDFEAFRRDIPGVVAAMDRVVDVASYPLPEQEKEAHNKRRMGLGVTGLANALEACGAPYGSTSFLRMQSQILEMLRDEAYMASARLAETRGAFPLYREEYLEGEFIQTLPQHIRDVIELHGIRNSHLLSIAPTGTISMTADNVSSGIEPVFDHTVNRSVYMDGGKEQIVLVDYGVRTFEVHGKRASEVTVDEHLAVLECAARLVDSAVSKTMNVPSDTPWPAFKSIYFRAWEAGCKGCTTFQVGGKRAPMMEATSCRIDKTTGRQECD